MTGIRAGACLSLTGRFAPFGTQAANGLCLWADMTGAELAVLDDESEPAVLTERLDELAPEVDVLFGPYSTVLMRAAISVATAAGRLLFNHGGSGGDLSRPGGVVNVLTPARRYADPFVALLAATADAPLFTAAGRGTFGRHVINGGRNAAHAAGLNIDVFDPADPPAGTWDLLSAGVYEDDIAAVRHAQALPNPPRLVCSVAAGVARFAQDVENPEGVYGIGQWAPGVVQAVDTGMDEAAFLGAWSDRFNDTPDYPAVQAYAAGVIAGETARRAESTDPGALWQEVAGLDIATVFGRFRIDSATGEQIGHNAVLTQWHNGYPAASAS